MKLVGRLALVMLLSVAVVPGSSAAEQAASKKPAARKPTSPYGGLRGQALMIYNLRRVLRPFVATCSGRKTYFRKLFCNALNDRLKAQHQAKLYRYVVEPSAAGPLVASFTAGPEPALELKIRGCLTCAKPMLERAGGDITTGRFFTFKQPQQISVKRGQYELSDIDLTSYRVPLAKKATGKLFNETILPHLRAELLFRPVAGVTRVGKGRYKYGVINFELVGHRVFHKCTGRVYGAMPASEARVPVDKNDLTCPQNQPKQIAKGPKLPSALPRAKVKQLMEDVGADLHTCYNQFGGAGDVPADIVVLPNGKVKIVKIAGKLSGSPTAHCVERLLRNVSFPRFKGESARLQWPFKITK